MRVDFEVVMGAVVLPSSVAMVLSPVVSPAVVVGTELLSPAVVVAVVRGVVMIEAQTWRVAVLQISSESIHRKVYKTPWISTVKNSTVWNLQIMDTQH